MTEVNTHISIGKLSDVPYIYKNEEDYLFGRIATKRIVKIFFPNTLVSSEAVNVIRKTQEDVFFDVLRNAYLIANPSTKRRRIRDIHITILTDSSAIGYPVLINKQLRDMTIKTLKNFKSDRKYALVEKGPYWSNKALMTVAKKSGIKVDPMREAIKRMSDFLVKCTAYYLSNTIFLNSLIRRKVIDYNIAVAGKIVTRLPNNTNDDIQREEIKKKISVVGRKKFRVSKVQKDYSEQIKRMKELNLVKLRGG